ncbi:putative peptidase M24 [Rosellinia necatrix]|uniref:Putative peptidase M24 n=1 Tax=Rosellinia necatrix TaxID=77044 RepID=A0A1W2TJA7_ROSNE|nr:putative peptidase M24 [Rosellinia necatrix]
MADVTGTEEEQQQQQQQLQQRAASLKDAQDKALQLFDEIARTLVRAGVSEAALSREIHELGQRRHGVRTHWHKRVVRSGPNTLQPYAENPADRVLAADDILFVDLGPVFEAWEADFGRTYVLGDDPAKVRLRDALEPVWRRVKARFDADPDITGEQLYAAACRAAEDAGWAFGGAIAGHLIGSFPHERIPNDKKTLYITEGNGERMRSLGKDGRPRHWILEIHLVDRERQIGGFFEQLLTVE